MRHEEDLLEQAALWLDRLNSVPEPLDREEFQLWLQRSPQNRHAFTRVSNVHKIVSTLVDNPEIQDLRRQALSRQDVAGAQLCNQTWLRGVLEWVSSPFRLRPAFATRIAAVALSVGIGGFLSDNSIVGTDVSSLWSSASPEMTYNTARGKQATIDLADGSQVILNTESQVRVQYSDRGRHVILDRGQAFFKVAKDKHRPFTVNAGNQIVTAVGTEFDVRLAAKGVRVALLEGKVTVASTQNVRSESVALLPNQVFSSRGDKSHVSSPLGVVTDSAWREGVLVFQDEELLAAVAEMNRYGTARILIKDNKLTNLKVSGSFQIGNTQGFIETIEELFSEQVEIQVSGNNFLISSR